MSTTCSPPLPSQAPSSSPGFLHAAEPQLRSFSSSAPRGFREPTRSPREGPPWLENFLSYTYFNPCAEHQFNKNEKNHFCIDCAEGPLCSRGLLANHAKHRTLQVRKASHADGVRVENVCKLLDISSIQTYIINNHKIVFLLRQAKGKLAAKPVDGTIAARHCQICGRLLSDLVKFCSIKCKLIGVRRQQEINGGTCTTLSLSPEVRPSPSRGFQYIFDNLQNLSPNYASDPNLAAAASRAFEEYRRKRELEVAPLSMKMECDNVKVGSVVSPVSVLDHTLKPSYALDHTQLASMEIMDFSMHKNLLIKGLQRHDDMVEERRTMQDDADENKMRLEVSLIHKLLLSSRRKRRKSSPHRAPLS